MKKKGGKEKEITRKEGRAKRKKGKKTNQQTKIKMKISMKNEFIFLKKWILSHHAIPTSQPLSSCHGKTFP